MGQHVATKLWLEWEACSHERVQPFKCEIHQRVSMNIQLDMHQPVKVAEHKQTS